MDPDGQMGEEGRGTPDEWSDSESLGSGDSEDDEGGDDSVDDVYVGDGNGKVGGPTGDGEDASPESTTKASSATDRPPPTSPLLPIAQGDDGGDSNGTDSSAGSNGSGSSNDSSSPETEVAVTEPGQSRRAGPGSAGGSAPAGVLKTSGSNGGGVGALANLKPVKPTVLRMSVELETLGDPGSPLPMVRFAEDEGGGGGAGAGGGEGDETLKSSGGAGSGRAREGGGAEGGGGEGRALKKAATLPVMPKNSLLSTGNRPKGGRKSVQFQVGCVARFGLLRPNTTSPVVANEILGDWRNQCSRHGEEDHRMHGAVLKRSPWVVTYLE